jgi:CelD/BcsL family acetyltransferase involved in cellulose biosynthesis
MAFAEGLSLSRTDAEPGVRGTSRTRYAVSIARSWSTVRDEWLADQESAAATAFQDGRWCDALFGVLAAAPEFEPLLVTVRDAANGSLALRLPFVLRTQGRLRTIEFADLELTDYNGPQLGPSAPTTPAGAKALWRDVTRALPRADAVRFRKMPMLIGDRPNPLAMLAGVRPCVLNGNLLSLGDDWEAHRFAREKTFRKELERSWRVFTRDPAARFFFAKTDAEAVPVLSALETQQAARMHDIGANYLLDAPLQARFYRDLANANVSGGYVRLSALAVGEEIVASLFGVRVGDTYVMVRIGNAGGQWTNVSPGRLIIEKTMEQLHAEGVRHVDFSVGNYAYKRRFCIEATPLVDYTQALGIKGLALSLRDHAAAKLRQYPHVREKVMRVLGKREVAQNA